MFSERSISAVPIIDEEGVVVNLYETVDVIVRTILPSVLYWPHLVYQTLVRLGAYQSLDLKISEALNQRSPDFPGIIVCSPSDSLGTFLQLMKMRRVHRLVVVEGEVSRSVHRQILPNHRRYRKRKGEAARKVASWVLSRSVIFFATSSVGPRLATSMRPRKSRSPHRIPP